MELKQEIQQFIKVYSEAVFIMINSNRLLQFKSFFKYLGKYKK